MVIAYVAINKDIIPTLCNTQKKTAELIVFDIESILWYNSIVTESDFEIISFEKIKPMKEAGIYLKEAGKEIKALIVLNTIFTAVYIISSIQFNPENTEKVESFMIISAIVVGLTNFFLMYSIGKNLVDAGNKLLDQ